MWKLLSMSSLLSLLLLCSSAALVSAQNPGNTSSKWQTLSGDAPLVIARGGFSGIFSDSSAYAYQLAVQTGLLNLHVWCDVQLTKDGAGICFPDIRLENASDINTHFGNKQNTYTVNGEPVKGWFSVDFTLKELENVILRQRIYSRPPYFDANPMQILTVNDVVSLTKPAGLWLNIPNDAFFSQHNLSMRIFIISLSRRTPIKYISSPEVGFLRSILSRFRTKKLVFQFLGPDVVEPTTNQKYSSLRNNLTFIKTFATGILVPKDYILPVDSSLYLRDYTSLVPDAHKEGLEVFAYNFVNDVTLPYNYSYDPVAEYLSFIDNGQSSVDGVLSDFPITPSATIDCFSHMGKNETAQAKLLIISSEGASGNFPGCTDKAYAKAISDGADILDCPVQMTNDGIPFCLGSINLKDRTNAAESPFITVAETNPDLNIMDGIFAYSLNWSEIQTLKPVMFNPYSKYSLFRNPKASREGKFVQLSDFLTLADNAPSVSGVVISIEHAAYLAEKQGLGVTEAILGALRKAGQNNQTAKKIMIKSNESAVLSKFKNSDYRLVYVVDEDVRDILNSTILEIKKFASSVVISKRSVFPTHAAFLTGETSVVRKLQAFGLTVYVKFFRNEFVSQPWDFFSDPYVEINTHVNYMGIDGVITDYPATAARYRRNRCLSYKELPVYMTPVQPGGLLPLLSDLPPAEAPSPALTENDVAEPPLPPVTVLPPPPVTVPPPSINSSNSPASPGATPPTPQNEQPTLVASTILSVTSMLLAAFLC